MRKTNIYQMTKLLNKRGIATLAALIAGGLVLSGCETNPATGKQEFSLISSAQEQALGAQEHPKILKAYGGAYNDPKVSGYVAQIGGTMAANSDLPAAGFRFTVVNSPIVNAFALPGGYVYASRGLVALANSEAELASVLGHEVAHVTARHTAQRYTRAQGVGLLGAVVGLATGSEAATQLFNVGGTLFVLKYSRDQEYQSDEFGVKYLHRAGYDPYAMGDFLSSLQAQSTLHAKIEGKESDANRVEYFSTHPNTSDRVARAYGFAGQTGLSRGERPRRSNTYLNAIDGMIYGDDPEQGFIRDRRFDHPKLRIHFEVPQGYRMSNQSSAVIAKGPSGSVVQFDAARNNANSSSISYYLTNIWAAGELKVNIGNVQTRSVNGMNMAMGTGRVNTKSGAADLRLVAYDQGGGQVYRFMILTNPQASAGQWPGLQGMINSFRRLSQSEASKLKPLRLRVVTVQRGDTVSGLAARMAFSDFKVERFRVLNRLGPNQGLQAGQRVKIVTE